MVQCSPYTKKGKGEVNIIPKPKEVVINDGLFLVNKETKILADNSNEEVRSVAEYLAGILRPSTGFDLNIENGKDASNSIKLIIDPEVKGSEGVYRLVTDKNGVTISAPDATGLFYGVQSLRQLLPVAHQ